MGLNFMIDFNIAEAGLNMWYSTNRNMPGHQCHALEYIMNIADIDVSWGTTFRELDYSSYYDTITWNYNAYSLPVPLFSMGLLEDMAV